MFHKIKIKLKNGRLYKIRLGHFTFFEYGREEGKKFFRFPFLKKPQKDKIVFYLKVNSRSYNTTLPCLQIWLNVVKEMKGDFYILCDDDILERRILKSIVFENSDVKVIRSERSKFKQHINNICSSRWVNAAYAHISVYLHAQKYGIREFWNIDADDTMIFASFKDISKSLNMAADYARKHNLEAFSWDMHRTSFYGLHWTFGVTFTRLNTNIASILEQAGNGEWKKVYSSCIIVSDDLDTNLDCFFSYLLDKGQIKLGTFNIENVYFMHWGIANILEYFKTLQIVQDNKMYYPVSGIIDESKGYIPCAKDVVCFDAGISKQESQKVLQAKLHDYLGKLTFLAKHYEEPKVKKTYQDFLKR